MWVSPALWRLSTTLGTLIGRSTLGRSSRSWTSDMRYGSQTPLLRGRLDVNAHGSGLLLCCCCAAADAVLIPQQQLARVAVSYACHRVTKSKKQTLSKQTLHCNGQRATAAFGTFALHTQARNFTACLNCVNAMWPSPRHPNMQCVTRSSPATLIQSNAD